MYEDANSMMKEMARYTKFLFEQGMVSMRTMFEHADRMTDFLAGQGDATQSDVQKRFKEWLESSKKIRDDYIKVMGENFKKIDEYLKIG